MRQLVVKLTHRLVQRVAEIRPGSDPIAIAPPALDARAMTRHDFRRQVLQLGQDTRTGGLRERITKAVKSGELIMRMDRRFIEMHDKTMQRGRQPVGNRLGKLAESCILGSVVELAEHLRGLTTERDDSGRRNGSIALDCPLHIALCTAFLADAPHLRGRDRLHQNTVQMRQGQVHIIRLGTDAQVMPPLPCEALCRARLDSSRGRAGVPVPQVIGQDIMILLGHFITY